MRGALWVWLAVVPGGAGAQVTALPPTSSPGVDRLLARVESAYAAMDAERFVALFTEDVTQIDVNRRLEIHGEEAWLRQTRSVNAAHREMSRVHRGRMAQGNLVVVEVEWAGTVRGEEFGSGAGDRRYRFGGLAVLELSGERIRRQVVYIDYASLQEQVARAPAPPGKLYDVGGRRMHLHCVGTGRPTVVVDGGAGNWSTHWVHLLRDLAAISRTCLFDRAGLGWSDPAAGPRTSTAAADDLARLLAAAEEQGPFVLVGHSYGGYNARVFQAKYPDRVRGIVLVESGHEDQWIRLPPPLAEVVRASPPFLRERAAAIRTGAVVEPEPIDSGFRDPEQRRLLEAAYRTPGPFEELAGVLEAMDSSTAAVRRSGRLGSLPLVVVTARRSFDAFRHLPIAVDSSNTVWFRLQEELAGLSSCRLHLWSDAGDHNLQVTDPAAVLEAVRAMLRSVSAPHRCGPPLRGG